MCLAFLILTSVIAILYFTVEKFRNTYDRFTQITDLLYLISNAVFIVAASIYGQIIVAFVFVILFNSIFSFFKWVGAVDALFHGKNPPIRWTINLIASYILLCFATPGWIHNSITQSRIGQWSVDNPKAGDFRETIDNGDGTSSVWRDPMQPTNEIQNMALNMRYMMRSDWINSQVNSEIGDLAEYKNANFDTAQDFDTAWQNLENWFNQPNRTGMPPWPTVPFMSTLESDKYGIPDWYKIDKETSGEGDNYRDPHDGVIEYWKGNWGEH